MIYRIILFLFLTQFAIAQDDVKVLVDSLAQTTTEAEKATLSMVIASKLADQDWKRALNYIDFAEKSAKKSKSDSITADIHIAVAEIYSDKEAYDISLEHFLQAYAYYQNKPLKERYRLENDVAIAYLQTGHPDEALGFFKKLSVYEHTKESPVKSASVFNNIALVWMRKDLDSAMVYFNKSLQLVKEEDVPDLKIFLFTNLGRCATLTEDSQEAKRFFNLAINENNKLRGGRLAWIYSEFSELYLKNNELDSAIYYSRNAVEMLDSVAPFTLSQLKASEVLYKAYIKNEDFEKASNYFEKYAAITDSLSIEDRSKCSKNCFRGRIPN